jgi:hypothetical protein
VFAVAQRADRGDEEEEVRPGLGFGFGDAPCRLGHHRGGRIDIVVRGDSSGEGFDEFDLGDDVEAASDVALQVDEHEGFEAGAEPRLRPAHPLRDGTDETMAAGEHGDDAVGFAELVPLEHDAFITIIVHRPIIA